VSYLALKKVKGNYYLYRQESYREGGKVRTRTLAYYGAVSPSVGQQVEKTKREARQTELKALVYNNRKTVREILKQTVKETPEHKVITTKKVEPIKRALIFPSEIKKYNISVNSLYATRDRYTKRLNAFGISETELPTIKIELGSKDGIKRKKDGSYIVNVRVKNKLHFRKINRIELWKNYREALGRAYLESIEIHKENEFSNLRCQLDESHKQTRVFLFESLTRTQKPMERLQLSLQLYLWNKVPRQIEKKINPSEVGQANFSTLKDWKKEVCFVMSEVQKKGWKSFNEKNKLAKEKTKNTIRSRKYALKKMSRGEKIVAKISGKKRRLLTEILHHEQSLRATQNLEKRLKIIKENLKFK
jgi:hypothetical protein